jgi:hypothetical protein
MQLRAVALGDVTTPRDARRDRDIEELWCGDVKDLMSLLSEHGDTVTIEKALPVGAVPLKVVSTESEATSVADVRHHRQLRRE